MMEFTKDWSKEVTKDGRVIYRSMLDLVIKEKETLMRSSIILSSVLTKRISRQGLKLCTEKWIARFLR